MVISLLTTATGSIVTSESSISWEQEVVGPVTGGGVLLAFIGGVDSQKPIPVSATFSGSALSPFADTPMSVVMSPNGAGGRSFPCAFVFSLIDPVSLSGPVTGTINVTFDQPVSRMQGMSAIFVGGSGVLDGTPSTLTINTQTPDFSISGSVTTTAPGSLAIDFCMGESSNHNDQFFPNSQTEFGNILMVGPGFNTTYSGIDSPGEVSMVRSVTGGPFAGTTLGVFAIKDL